MTAEWPTAAEWLAGTPQGATSAGGSTGPAKGDLLVVAGIPLREGAVTPSRYDLAPAAIRAFLERLSAYHSERNVDLSLLRVVDLGDGLEPPALDARLTVLLGGHNGVTYEALSRRADLASWGLLTLDAHHDVREYAAGSPGNGSPVRALVDAGLPGTNIVQVGIAGFSNVRAHRRWCEEIGVTIRGTGSVREVTDLLDMLARRCDHVYVDLDIDVLDRAFAPGAPGARPGGITPRELFEAAYEAGNHGAVRAVDIVEVDPQADVASVTVGAAAISLLNVAAGFASRDGRS